MKHRKEDHQRWNAQELRSVTDSASLTRRGNFNFALLFLDSVACHSHETEMAPLGDADYCREKARRDLLTLLEGVSIVRAYPSPG